MYICGHIFQFKKNQIIIIINSQSWPGESPFSEVFTRFYGFVPRIVRDQVDMWSGILLELIFTYFDEYRRNVSVRGKKFGNLLVRETQS